MHQHIRHLCFALGVIVSAAAELIAAPGDLYVSSLDEVTPTNGRIIRISPDGTQHVFAQSIADPYGIVFDPAGNLLVTSDPNNTIYKFKPDGTRTNFASGLSGPIEMRYDSSGNLYVACIRANAVFKVSPTGATSTFANGISRPLGIGVDSANNVYASTFSAGLVTKITSGGTKSTFASGLSGRLYSIAFDSGGNLLLAERDTGIVSKFTPQGAKSTYLSGLASPFGLLFDAAGNLYISEHDGGRITKVTPDGVRSVFAEQLGSPAFMAIEPGQPPEPGPSNAPVNISSRARVGTDNDVLIGGFIISGNANKSTVVRAIGPSLAASGVADPLQDPLLEIYDAAGTLVASNDNWKDQQQAQLEAAHHAPSDDREAAALVSLPPGAYTAIVSGNGRTTGVGLVEIYDNDPSADAKLVNISSRGLILTGDNVMIGGFILNGTTRVLVRGIGPSLQKFGIVNPLPDPVLSLVDSSGTGIAASDNWRQSQQTEIEQTGRAPENDLESAIVATLPTGAYTAIVSGANGTTGVGLVEIYALP